MIIDHTRCTHDTDAQARARCRRQRQEVRDELAKTIEYFMGNGDISAEALSAWRGMDPKVIATFMMSAVDTVAQFQTDSALAALRG